MLQIQAMKNILILFLLMGFVFLGACKKDNPPGGNGDEDLTNIPYNPQAYAILKPEHFPQIPVPPDNPMTYDGVQLGRRLFYDPILSGDSTQSCSSCHLPAGNFTDNLAFSKGIDGIAGNRSSMSLLNIAYAFNGLFWDGRALTLEDQALQPVENTIELHTTWPSVVAKLRNHPKYPEWFRKAFGIASKKDISKELAAKAIAQFERILISSGKSKYDRFLQGDFDALSDEENDGRKMYFDEGANVPLPDAECFHCHGGLTLTGNVYENNGIDAAATLFDFIDKGRGEVTKDSNDNGRFRAPTLRNIALSAPYMHDGRFKTLDEVLEHYKKGGKYSPNRNGFIHPLGFRDGQGGFFGFTDEHKQSILKFLHALTDTAFVKNPDIQNPF